jgi:hypothetical protein
VRTTASAIHEFHRQISGRALPFAALLMLCAVTAVPAHAADAPKPVVVASDGGVELVANDADGQLCLAVRSSAESPFTRCEDAALGIVMTEESPGVLHVGAAVPSSAATVELWRAARLLGSAATVAGEAYTGAAAGKVRFALARLPSGRPEGLRVHAKDGAGKLVTVLASLDGDLLLDRRRLLRGRSGGVTWTATEERTSSLEPSVIDLARENVRRCVELTFGGHRLLPGVISHSLCSSAEPRGDLGFGSDVAQANLLERCRPDIRLVYGIVPASVRSATVLLGDGRRRSAPLSALRDGLWRVYAVAIARGDAVRGVTLRGAGAPERFKRLAAAPLSVICSAKDDEVLTTETGFLAQLAEQVPVTSASPVATIDGTPAIRVADGPGDSLCLAIGDKPFTVLGCSVVSPQLDLGSPVVAQQRGAMQFAMAVPARVAAIRLSNADRSVARTIPTVAGEAYTGRYAGYVRFAAVTVTNRSLLPRLELLDAAGIILHVVQEERGDGIPFEFSDPRVLSARRVAGRVGGPSLWQTTLRGGSETRRCLSVTAGPRPSEDDRCQATRSNAAVLLDASCVTHRLTVAVVAAPGTRVRAHVDGAAPRSLRLRNGVGLLTLPASKPLRSLTLTRRGRSQRVQIQAPAGARQCGWNGARKIEQR